MLDPRGLVLQQLAPHHRAYAQRHGFHARRRGHHVVHSGAVGLCRQCGGTGRTAVAEAQDAEGARSSASRRQPGPCPPGILVQRLLPRPVEPGAETDPVEAGRLQVDHDAVERVGCRVQQRCCAGRPGRAVHLVSVARQEGCQRLVRVRIPDEQDAGAPEQAHPLAEPGRRDVGRQAGRARLRAALAKQRPDAHHHQPGVCGFRHVGVGAAFQPFTLQAGLGRFRQHQHRDRLGAHVQPERAGELAAVHARQVVVRHHQVRQVAVQAIERRLGAGRTRHGEARPLQHTADLQRLRFRVLDQQQVRGVRRRAAHGRTAHGGAAQDGAAHDRAAHDRAAHDRAARSPEAAGSRGSRDSVRRMRGAIPSSGMLAHEPPSRTATAGMPYTTALLSCSVMV